MPDLFLIRHAQASFGKANYDSLTELGWQQARWLGEALREMDVHFDRFVTGSLKRHIETAEALAETLELDLERETIPDLNEYDFAAILDAYHKDREVPKDLHTDRRTHFRVLRDAIQAWQRDELENLPERWSEFESRVTDALISLCDPAIGKSVLAISSGGPIAQKVRSVLSAPPQTMIKLNLQMKNSGVTRLVFTSNAMYLNMFNAAPHLETGERAKALTYS